MKDESIDEALRIARLLQLARTGTIPDKELQALKAWLAADQKNMDLYRRLSDPDHWKDELNALEQYDADRLRQRIFSSAGFTAAPGTQNTGSSVFRRLRHPAVKKWGMAAAAATLLIVAYKFLAPEKGTPGTVSQTAADSAVIRPGGNKATLTLGNGTAVTLKGNVSDSIALQGGSLVAQQQEGVLVYGKDTGGEDEIVWNTVATPKGGKYEIELSDGTHVFLNAASSLKFPVPFNKQHREVILSGEAFFEVSHAQRGKQAWPFQVRILRKGQEDGAVNVLGTHFNIMAYDDENVMKTTLVEGAVQMRIGESSAVLKPGQQAVWTAATNVMQVKPADLEMETAWKNGRFLFRSADTKSIMRQLSRWYDVVVEYQGDVSDVRFAGNIERKEDIRELIEILEADGRLRIETRGNKIIVSRKTVQGGKMN